MSVEDQYWEYYFELYIVTFRNIGAHCAQRFDAQMKLAKSKKKKLSSITVTISTPMKYTRNVWFFKVSGSTISFTGERESRIATCQ